MSDKLDLINTIAHEDKWSTFSRLIESSGARDWLSLEGEFTVFVPNNDAFGKIPDAKMNELLQEKRQATLRELLSYHFVPGLHPSSALTRPMKSITGQELTFTASNGLKVNGAMLQARNIQASNGVVHQVDTVLAPPMKTALKPGGILEFAKNHSMSPGSSERETYGPRRQTTIF
ncbi:MAG: fasciclin domain-containing protein [bacterium]|nr:fasciclin domain-containing protein [bacterium]